VLPASGERPHVERASNAAYSCGCDRPAALHQCVAGSDPRRARLCACSGIDARSAAGVHRQPRTCPRRRSRDPSALHRGDSQVWLASLSGCRASACSPPSRGWSVSFAACRVHPLALPPGSDRSMSGVSTYSGSLGMTLCWTSRGTVIPAVLKLLTVVSCRGTRASIRLSRPQVRRDALAPDDNLALAQPWLPSATHPSAVLLPSLLPNPVPARPSMRAVIPC